MAASGSAANCAGGVGDADGEGGVVMLTMLVVNVDANGKGAVVMLTMLGMLVMQMVRVVW